MSQMLVLFEWMFSTKLSMSTATVVLLGTEHFLTENPGIPLINGIVQL